MLERLLAEAAEQGVIATPCIAGSLAQAQALWRLARDDLGSAEARRRQHQARHLRADRAHPRVPAARGCRSSRRSAPARAPSCSATSATATCITTSRSRPAWTRRAFLALWDQMAGAVHDLVAEMGGSISAEHGIGQMKRAICVRFKSPIELALMRRIKAALDPKGILNPGKFYSPRAASASRPAPGPRGPHCVGCSVCG